MTDKYVGERHIFSYDPKHEKNIDAISESYNFELKILQNNVKEYINELSTYLTNYRNSTISACIKIFKRRNRNRNEFQSEEIITLARSSNTEYERNNQKQTFVGQNTDFTNLCNGQIIFFGSSNLNKINESGHYINDSVNWESKKYTSTLVTPIRYYNDNYGNQRNINIKSDIIGFLCIDSKDEIKEWESSDSFELQMMAVFSDRKNKRTEKKRVLKNNRIIVKVNNDIIYDSKKQKEMPDDLYYALLSYGLKESINSKTNKKTPINYTFNHSISAVPIWNEDILVRDAI